VYIPDHKIVNNGWAQINSTHVVGDELTPVPTKLALTWFSFAEDKFYAGNWQLPYDEIADHFEQGVTGEEPGGTITYETIIVGMAPRGEVSIWLDATGLSLEIASYQANEVDHDWNVIEEQDRAEYIGYIMSTSIPE